MPPGSSPLSFSPRYFWSTLLESKQKKPFCPVASIIPECPIPVVCPIRAHVLRCGIYVDPIHLSGRVFVHRSQPISSISKEIVLRRKLIYLKLKLLCFVCVQKPGKIESRGTEQLRRIPANTKQTKIDIPGSFLKKYLLFSEDCTVIKL